MARLLIVDDDRDFASAASTVLSSEGHEVKIELDASKAVDTVRDTRPELIVLDVMFPEDSAAGFEIARRIRHYEDEEIRNIPILLLTAVNARFPLGFSSRDIDDYWMPVSDFLEKPVDFKELLSKVDGLLKKSAEGDGECGSCCD